MENSSKNKFTLSKRVRLLSKIVGYNAAFNLLGSSKLGQGEFGSVYSSKGAAIKVAHPKKQKQLEHEVEMLKEVKDIKVAPKLLATGKGYAAIQKFEGNPLSKYYAKLKDDAVFADYIFRKIVESIGALHRKNIAHRDLHSGNIFITNNYEVKIIDYGQAIKGSRHVYNELVFGNNDDVTTGVMGLVEHLFRKCQSFKTYKKILANTVKKICSVVGADFSIVTSDYENISEDDKKSSQYFDEQEKLYSFPKGDKENIIESFYNSIDSALRIDTKNPATTKRIRPKSNIVSNVNVNKTINRKPESKPGILKFEQGGVVPEGNQQVELHGQELIIPKQKQLNVKVNHPELFSELQYIKTSYMWGQNGLYDLEFESDIDRAIYFAGKLGNDKENTPAKVAVREWLFLVTGLNVREDYDEVKKYRTKILDLIRQLVNLHPEERNVIIPPVYDGYYQDPEDDEEDDEEEPEGLDDLLNKINEEDDEEEPAGLDDLLNEINKEDDEEEPEGLDELLNEIKNKEDQESDIDPDILSDLPPSLQNSLAKVINKKTNKRIFIGDKKPSSAITNTKIYKFLTENLTKITNELNSINASITEQNLLLKSNIDLNIDMLQSLENQDSMIVSKLDAILELYNNQTNSMRKIEDDLKKSELENKLEAQRDSAFTSSFDKIGGDTLKSGGLFARLLRFFGKKLWKLLPRRFRALARLLKKGLKPSKLLGRLASKIAGKKAADKVAEKTTKKFVAKGFEHIALPALKSSDNLAAKGIQKTGDNLLVRALKSRIIQQALIKKIGKEGAEKLTVKLAAKLIPGVSTAYGLGEGLARIAMGDVKGGFLSFGSAIPVAGYGFAAVDILRDIDTAAYTKHIEGPAMSGKLKDEQIAAFFTEALGVTENQYETGVESAKPGTAMLHGTEMIIKKDEREQIENNNPMRIVGGSLLSATTNYINAMGPMAATIAPTFKQIAAPIAEQYDIPKTFVQTNVGGALPNLGQEFKKIKDKRKQTPEEELEGIEKDLLDTKNPESFAEKLLKIIDPKERFQDLLRNLNKRTPLGGAGGEVGADPFVLLGGSQDPGQAGIDFTLKGTQNRAVLAGTVVQIKHQYNPNATGGDGRKGAGYGNYIVIRSINPIDGSQVDMLYAHFPKGEIKVKEGDQVSVGQDLGRMATSDEYANPATRREVGSGTGPHTSLDFFKPGSNKAHHKARQLGDYILKELRKGPKGAIEQARQQAYQQQQIQRPQQSSGDYDIIIPLDHVKPGNENKIPDKRGGNTFKNASATGAAGRERQHQDSAAAKIKAKLEAKGLRVKIITPEDFGNYEDYDNYIRSQAGKGTRIVPLHFDAAVGQGGTGFLTRIKAGDRDDAALAAPIQAQLSMFQKANPRLGNLGPTDTQSNATINRAAAAPATLVEMGSMIAWEREHGNNFTSSSKFNELATAIAEGIYKGGKFGGRISPPSGQRQRFESMQGKDKNEDTKHLIVNQTSRPEASLGRNSTVQFVPMGDGRWKTQDEYSSTIRNLIMSRLR